MSTLIESTGTVSLFYTPINGAAGCTFSVQDGGVIKTIKDYGGTVGVMGMNSIVAAYYFNGYRVVVFDGGHTWCVDSNWQKAPVGSNGVDTAQLSNAQIATLGAGAIVNPFYTF